LLTQAHPDAVRRVPLLPGCLPIARQDLVNERDRRLQFRVRPFRFLPWLGRGAGNRLRTIRRCTFTFLATPAIVPTPNSSNSSTLALQSNGLPLSGIGPKGGVRRSEEHTSELQSPYDLVCRLLLEKKKITCTRIDEWD